MLIRNLQPMYITCDELANSKIFEQFPWFVRILGPSPASLAQSSWSLLAMDLVMGPLLGRIASLFHHSLM